MRVTLEIPKEFEKDFHKDKFKDFFGRVIADIDCRGLCGNYERETAEMFIKVFDESRVNLTQCKAFSPERYEV